MIEGIDLKETVICSIVLPKDSELLPLFSEFTKDFKVEVDHLINEKGLKKDEAIFNVLREYIKQSKKILFEGDGYSDAWEKEAKKRGLSNYKTTPLALKAKVSKAALDLFKEIEKDYEFFQSLPKLNVNLVFKARFKEEIFCLLSAFKFPFFGKTK